MNKIDIINIERLKTNLVACIQDLVLWVVIKKRMGPNIKPWGTRNVRWVKTSESDLYVKRPTIWHKMWVNFQASCVQNHNRLQQYSYTWENNHNSQRMSYAPHFHEERTSDIQIFIFRFYASTLTPFKMFLCDAIQKVMCS